MSFHAKNHGSVVVKTMERPFEFWEIGEMDQETNNVHVMAKVKRQGRTNAEWKLKLGVGTKCPAVHHIYPWIFAVDVTDDPNDYLHVTIHFRPLEFCVEPGNGPGGVWNVGV